MSLCIDACNKIITPGVPNNEMPSPSKLAAQRIYSSARNHISFYTAQQCNSDELAQLGSPNRYFFQRQQQQQQQLEKEEQQRREQQPAEEQQQPRQQQLQNEQPQQQQWQQSNLLRSDEKEAKLSAKPTFSLPPAADAIDLQQLIKENTRQYALVQKQIELLHEWIAQLSAATAKSQITAPVPSITVAPAPASAAAAQIDQQPSSVPQQSAPQTTLVQEATNTIFVVTANAWTVLLLATIFIVGLIQVVEWLVRHTAMLFSRLFAGCSANEAKLIEKNKEKK